MYYLPLIAAILGIAIVMLGCLADWIINYKLTKAKTYRNELEVVSRVLDDLAKIVPENTLNEDWNIVFESQATVLLETLHLTLPIHVVARQIHARKKK